MDMQRKEQFEERMIGTLNGAALTLMASVGHRTRLFDVMAELPPSTSHELARAARLDERYVREWLGAMVAGGIVETDPEAGTYRLPEEHAALLTRDAGSHNLAAVAQWVAVLGDVETRIVDCFRDGGGLAYSDYPRFHEVMAEQSSMTVLEGLFDHVLPLVPSADEKLVAGIDVLDVGCGAGRVLVEMAAKYPHSRFTGRDICPDALEAGRAAAHKRGLENVHFEVADVAMLEDDARHDLVTAFDSIHDQQRPDAVLSAIHRTLKPGGTFLMQDIKASSHHHGNTDHPLGAFVYTVSCMHCMSVSLGQGGAGLGAAWGEEKAREMLDEAGFHLMMVEQLPHDALNNYYVCAKA